MLDVSIGGVCCQGNLVRRIEEEFEVERCLFVVGLTEGEGGIALRGSFAVEHIVSKGIVGADVEGVLLAEVSH